VCRPSAPRRYSIDKIDTGGGAEEVVGTVWIDVAMSSGLSGSFHPLTEFSCDLPQPPPTTVAGWQQWATAQLGALAAQEVWQPGRYGYTVERRDRLGNTLQLLSRGVWQLVPQPAR
jgi:hypothetical protein